MCASNRSNLQKKIESTCTRMFIAAVVVFSVLIWHTTAACKHVSFRDAWPALRASNPADLRTRAPTVNVLRLFLHQRVKARSEGKVGEVEEPLACFLMLHQRKSALPRPQPRQPILTRTSCELILTYPLITGTMIVLFIESIWFFSAGVSNTTLRLFGAFSIESFLRA